MPPSPLYLLGLQRPPGPPSCVCCIPPAPWWGLFEQKRLPVWPLKACGALPTKSSYWFGFWYMVFFEWNRMCCWWDSFRTTAAVEFWAYNGKDPSGSHLCSCPIPLDEGPPYRYSTGFIWNSYFTNLSDPDCILWKSKQPLSFSLSKSSSCVTSAPWCCLFLSL